MASKAKATKHKAGALPFGVGDAILIRTVTMIQLGRVVNIGADFFVLEDAGWVADTGRFSVMLETGAVNEYERAPSWVLVGRGAVVDVFPWKHALPSVTK
jgi:hypothetical protein